ncbi:YfhO family protein [Nocardioides sp. YIM 152315]|uniref:YfhO family protein n=1 Tax=Nocardioides sp. YIM 152315 TaxID=3031760 RepID=UPI0023D9BC80|nr:YfhO family protein [Nocardioides sp. YIM 152315]
MWARLTGSPVARSRAAVTLVFAAATLVLAWPTLRGRTISVVPTFQTATYPWAADPRGLAYAWAQSDSAESSYPWSALAQRTWRDGALPLWDPHSFGGGTPLAVDGVSATLYPVRAVLDTAFPLWLAHDLFFLLHIVAAGLATYWLARRWGCRRAGATFAGVGWMTSAYVWGWAQLEMVTPFLLFLPLALAACDRAVKQPTRRSFVVAAVVLALGMVAGNIAYALVVMATAAFYVLALLVARAWQSRERRPIVVDFLRAGLLLGLGLALSAVVVLPTLLNLSRVSREPYTFEQIRTSLLVPWHEYTRLVTPPPSPPTALDLNLLMYVAPVVLGLALVGLTFPGSRPAGIGRLLLLIVPVLAASAAPVAWLTYHLLPGFDTVLPSRLLPVSLLAVHLLAAVGLDRLLSWLRPLPRRRFTVPVLKREAATPSVAVVLTAALLLAVFWPSFAVGRSLNPPDLDVDEHPLFPVTPALEAIAALDGDDDWPSRVVPGTTSLATDPPSTTAPALVGGTPLVPGVDSWGGYSSSTPERTSELMRVVSGEDQATVLGPGVPPSLSYPRFPTGAVDWPLACRLGTDAALLPPTTPDVAEDWGSLDPERSLTEVYSGPDGRVLSLPEACASTPYVATSIVRKSGDGAAFDALRDQGRRTLRGNQERAWRTVVPAHAPDLDVDEDATGEVTTAVRDGLDAVVDVRATGRVLVVLPISHDAGWQATIDGTDAPIRRVDFNRVGVVVGEGEHEVRLSYRPAGWTPGLVLTGLGLLACVALMAGGLVRGSRRSSPRPGRQRAHG